MTLNGIAEGKEVIMTANTSFWPNAARLAISMSLMYEGGGQPMSGAPGVIPEPIRNGLPDMTRAWYPRRVVSGSTLISRRVIRIGTAMALSQPVPGSRPMSDGRPMART
jgi:hypothetical protein